jgi:hypothetical protein
MVRGITATTLMMVSLVDAMVGAVPEVARQVFDRISSGREWEDIGVGTLGGCITRASCSTRLRRGSGNF